MTVSIGLIGAGTVGGGVIKILHQRKAYFSEQLGLPIHLSRVADKITSQFETLPVDGALCSTDASDVINDESINVVVELVGGTTFAKKIVLDALSHKKHVITANKALIAECGPEIFECAEKNGVSVYFEAAVGGGMPVIKSIREGLVGNTVLSIKTIINGTCNYILTRMSNEELTFKDVLQQAQENGYAEADPTLDIGGGDSGHKVAILASIISNGYTPFDKIPVEGITTISREDIEFAGELGYTIKLLGVINKIDNKSEFDVRVHPAMLHKNHILASVSDVFNAVLVDGDSVGRILLYGKGAGELPTASAVVGDIVDVARNIIGENAMRLPMNYYNSKNITSTTSIDDIISRYYLRFTVIDEPNIFTSIASFLGEQGISIASVIQKEGYSDDSVPVVILTHAALEKGLKQALVDIEQMDYIRAKTQMIRIEE